MRRREDGVGSVRSSPLQLRGRRTLRSRPSSRQRRAVCLHQSNLDMRLRRKTYCQWRIDSLLHISWRHASMESFQDFAAEPDDMLLQNWISAIAIDPSGGRGRRRSYAGKRLSARHPSQPANPGRADAFVATISADGSALNYATYFGGSGDDGALSVAVDPRGAHHRRSNLVCRFSDAWPSTSPHGLQRGLRRQTRCAADRAI